MTSKVHRILDKWIKKRLDIEKELIYMENPLIERINARKDKEQSCNNRDARKNKG